MEETRSNKSGFSLRKVKEPDSSLTVPATKAESGRDNNTTLAYGKDRFFSSTTLPVKVCAETEHSRPHSRHKLINNLNITLLFSGKGKASEMNMQEMHLYRHEHTTIDNERINKFTSGEIYTSELPYPLVKAFLVHNAEGFVNFLLCPKLAGRDRRGRDA